MWVKRNPICWIAAPISLACFLPLASKFFECYNHSKRIYLDLHNQALMHASWKRHWHQLLLLRLWGCFDFQLWHGWSAWQDILGLGVSVRTWFYLSLCTIHRNIRVTRANDLIGVVTLHATVIAPGSLTYLMSWRVAYNYKNKFCFSTRAWCLQRPQVMLSSWSRS